MSFLASIIVFFIMPLVSFIMFVLIIYMIMGWLFIFKIIDPSHPTARQIYGILSSVVNPILAPVRRIIPPLGNFDMGFLFVFMLLYWSNGYLLPRLVSLLG